MQLIFREFFIWVLQFLSISFGLLLAVHFLRRSLAKQKSAITETPNATTPPSH